MGLTNSQYDAIMREYNEIQYANRQLLLSRREEIAKRIPEIDEIDTQIAELSMEFALSALGDNSLQQAKPSSIPELSSSISRLSSQKKKLLSAVGDPEDYLEPVYRCTAVYYKHLTLPTPSRG